MLKWLQDVSTTARRRERTDDVPHEQRLSASAPQRGSELRWDRELFLSGEGVCPPEIDVTGLPRFVFFGPFITLEAGLWRAECELEFCADAALRVFALQFGAEPDYTTVDLQRGRPGLQRFVIQHRLSTAAPMQLRLWLKKAAFHGYVRFGGASIERIADAALPPCRSEV